MIQWTKDHDNLRSLLKKELEIMRHLIENLQQEEIFILNKDKTSTEALITDRALLITNLNVTRSSRLASIKKLESMKKGFVGNLEELLPVNNEGSWEIVSMLNQIVALLDRINFQGSRNSMLSRFNHYRPMTGKKKKPSVATLCAEEPGEF
jgi:hypothetical protein